MTPIDLAYIAGFIDADGCISLGRQRAKTTSGMTYATRISGFSIDCHVLEYIQSIFGGKITSSQPKNSKRIQYRWALNGEPAIACARSLSPYLRIKKEQAQLLCRFSDEKLFHKRGNKKNKIPLHEIARRDELAARSSYLNQRKYLEAEPK